MHSMCAWDWWQGKVNWETSAGVLLLRFFSTLPTDRKFRLCLYGSAPLQLALERRWLSAFVDVFSKDDEYLAPWVQRAGMTTGQCGLYVKPGFALSFRASPLWRGRTLSVTVKNVSLAIPHPLDILIGNLDRLEAKDMGAFRMVMQLTGHPTEAEFKHELQNAADLFRPAFDDESPNRYPDNTCRLWQEVWQAAIDVKADIIQPALARRNQGYGTPPPPYRRALDG